MGSTRTKSFQPAEFRNRQLRSHYSRGPVMAESTAHADLLEGVRYELSRVGATDIKVRIDEKFAPDVGPLVHIQHGSAYWHMLPAHFLAMLKELTSRAGSEAVKVAIEK